MVLGIYCSGGFGGVAFSVAHSINSEKKIWDKIIYIDDDPELVPDKTEIVTFEGFEKEYSNKNGQIVIAAGEPIVRERLFERVKGYGYSLPNLIHARAEANSIESIGEGNIVLSFSYISPSYVSIGDNNIFMPFTQVSHNNRIGSHCILATSATLSGNTDVLDKAYIGTGAKLREGIRIGHDSIVGMGAVVTKDVEDCSVVVGFPAKEIRKNDGRVFKRSKGT